MPRVLIAEDHADTLAAYIAQCTGAGFHLDTVSCGWQAWERYREAKAGGNPYDLLILDLQLRGETHDNRQPISGLRVAQMVRESGDKQTKIVFLTGMDATEATVAGTLIKVTETWEKLKVADRVRENIERILSLPPELATRGERRKLPALGFRQVPRREQYLWLAVAVLLVMLAALYVRAMRNSARLENLEEVVPVVVANRPVTFQARVPNRIDALTTLKDGRTRIMFEVAPEDRGKLEALASERNKPVRVRVD